MSISTLQRLYNKNGFVLIQNYFNSQQIRTIEKSVNKMSLLPEKKDTYMKFYEDINYNNTNKRVLSRMEYFYKRDNQLYEIVEHHLKPTIQLITENSVNLFKDKLNWKMPGGGSFKPHQDFEAWSDFPPQSFLTAAIFVDNSTIKNGCLQMAGGKHKEGLLDNDNGCLKKSVTNTMQWDNILAKKSDLVLFDSFTPHRSGINYSDNTRRVIYFTFNNTEDGYHYEDYFKKKRLLFPPDFERDENTKIDNNKNYKYNLANPIS